MRLGQLSRKLEIESSAIVKTLKEHFREVSNHPNVKIQDDELDFLMEKFGQKKSVIEPKIEAEQKPSKPVIDQQEEETKAVAPTPAFVESLRPKVITLESEFDAKKKELESYKAEKPELEGLRVLGKIELPESKPKTPKTEKLTQEEKKGTKTVNEKNLRQRDNRKDNRKRTNRSPAEEKKRAEQLAKRKKAQEERQLKELKKKHYEENVKAKIADKPKRKKKKKLVEKFEAAANPQPSPKQPQKSANPLVRFWRWLNGDYDKFQ